ncbi:UNVERIFIED_CONTAM: hypothetical protein FKN15_061447 [Acipenser sinensis]
MAHHRVISQGKESSDMRKIIPVSFNVLMDTTKMKTGGAVFLVTVLVGLAVDNMSALGAVIQEECIVRPRFILKQMEYTDRPALFISSSILVILSLGGGIFFFLRSRSKAQPKEKSGPALFISSSILVILSLGGGVFFFLRSRSKAQPKEKSGYEKLANSSKPISSFDPKRASVGSSYRQEHVIEYRDRVEKEEEEEDDEDEDIVYMGQDGTVYRKFKYGLLEDDDDEELEYDDESYSFR